MNVENLLLTGTGNISGTGNTLNNTLTGNSGNNTLNGGLGDDTLIGGLGNDTYVVDSVADVVTEAAGAGTTDTVQASVSYTLGANVERLTLTGTGNIDGTGNDLANTLTGNAGNNVLDGGTGADTMTGGAGNDTYVVDSTTDVVTESSGGGTDTVRASIAYTLGSNVENLVLTGTGNISGTGNTLANTLTGNAGNNALSGGTGADTMIGGAGDDTYTADNTGDIVTENAGEGTDTVSASVTYTLAANVENLLLTGTSALAGTGNALNNAISGNSGNNTLSGGDGTDTLQGGAGNDTLDGGLGTDTAIYSGPRANYNVVAGTGGSFTVADLRTGAPDGTDTIQNIELLQFSDITVPPGGGSNQPPVANNDSGTDLITPLNTPLTIAASRLLANDTDVDNLQSALTVANVGSATNGTVNFDGTNIVFTPTTGYTGAASFTYTASDGQASSNSATVSLTVGTPSANKIVLENQKPGNPKSEWDVTSYDSEHRGVRCPVQRQPRAKTSSSRSSTAASSYRIDIYRLGYYNGDGARKVATDRVLCRSSTAESGDGFFHRARRCGQLERLRDSWTVPADAVSGVYIAKLVRTDGTSGANHIPFVVRDDNGSSDVLFQTVGHDLAGLQQLGRQQSLLRVAGRARLQGQLQPTDPTPASAAQPGQPVDFLFDSEYPTIRFLEANGYDVSYFSGIDSDRLGAGDSRAQDLSFRRSRRILVGPATGQRRGGAGRRGQSGVPQRERGVLEDALGKQHRRHLNALRTLVSYKETHRQRHRSIPASQATGTWRDPRFETDAGRPENALTGQIFMVNDGSDSGAAERKITVPAEDGHLRFWRNTGLGTTSTTLDSDVLSYEWDEELDNGSRPAGLIRLSSTTDPSASYLQDYGSTYGYGSGDPQPHDVPSRQWRTRLRRRAPRNGHGVLDAYMTVRRPPTTASGRRR